MSDEGDIADAAFGVQAGFGFAGKAATAVVGFVGSVVLARALGPSDYGLFYVALSVAAFFVNPVTGWATACKKRLTEPDFAASEAVGSLAVAIGVLGVVGVPVGYVVVDAVTANPVLPLAVPVLFVPLAAYRSSTTLLSGRANFALADWALVVETVVTTIAQVAFVLLGFGLWGMVGGAVTGALVVLPVVYRWLGVRARLPSRESLRSVVAFSKWSIPRGFVGTGLSQMDVLLLGWLAAASAAGNYQVALKVSMPATFVSGAITAGLMGRVSALAGRSGGDWTPDFRNALSTGSVLAVPIFVGSLVLAESIVVTAFGGAYAGAGAFLVGLAAYRLLETQTAPRGAVLGGLDRPDLGFWVSAAELTINVALGLALWYAYGPLGIVAATVVTQAFAYAANTLLVRGLTDVQVVVTRPFLAQLGAGAVMGGVVFAAKSSVGIGGWPAVVGVVALGAAVYFLVLFAVSTYHRETVRGICADLAGSRDGGL
ncbi:oligosaccharide flippase family protein [Salarchaeum sp. III]|uniref:oligosaccharide flippase family protein n=1 Tax=Salarchaeum sp. III TaxID=3107927 RepID=UPI002EDB615E